MCKEKVIEWSKRMSRVKCPSHLWNLTACSNGTFTKRKNGEPLETGMKSSAMGK